MQPHETRQFLLEALSDQRAGWWGKSDPPPELVHREQRRRWREEQQRARQGWYRYAPTRWLGCEPTAAQRREFRAELLSMRDCGLLEIEFGRERILWVRLRGYCTESGVPT